MAQSSLSITVAGSTPFNGHTNGHINGSNSIMHHAPVGNGNSSPTSLPLSFVSPGYQLINAVRIAPSSDRNTCIAIESSNRIAITRPPTASSTARKRTVFSVQQALAATSDNEEVYRNLAPPLLRSVIEGRSATVIAIGQNGAGKSYSIIGAPASVGLFGRFVVDLFPLLQRETKVGYAVGVTAIEVDQDRAYDRLPESTSAPSAGGEVVALEIRAVHSAGDIDRLLERVRPLRSATSSAIYQITVQIAQSDNEFFTSKFSFVELAWVPAVARDASSPFERLSRSDQLVSAQTTTLFHLLTSLAANSDPAAGAFASAAVTYHNSTLTQLLSDSLDTRSTCILLACISPAAAHYRATYNTLYFADRAAKSRKSEPSENEPGLRKAATADYMEQHHVSSVLQTALNRMLVARPTNPWAYLSMELATLAGGPEMVFPALAALAANGGVTPARDGSFAVTTNGLNGHAVGGTSGSLYNGFTPGTPFTPSGGRPSLPSSYAATPANGHANVAFTPGNKGGHSPRSSSFGFGGGGTMVRGNSSTWPPAGGPFQVVFGLNDSGSGASVMCQQLSTELGGTWNHMNAGDVLARERDNKSSIVSSLIDTYLKDGKMVPSELTVQLLKASMEDSSRRDGVRNFIISGFPRNQENIDAWVKLMGGLGNKATPGNTAIVQFSIVFDTTKASPTAADIARRAEMRPVIAVFDALGLVRTISTSGGAADKFASVRSLLLAAATPGARGLPLLLPPSPGGVLGSPQQAGGQSFPAPLTPSSPFALRPQPPRSPIPNVAPPSPPVYDPSSSNIIIFTIANITQLTHLPQMRTLMLKRLSGRPYQKSFVVIPGGIMGPSTLAAFDHGNHIIEALSVLGVSHVSLSSHEFDYGKDALDVQLAKFLQLSRSYATSGVATPPAILSSNISLAASVPQSISELNNSGTGTPYRIGWFGTVTSDTEHLVKNKLAGDVSFTSHQDVNMRMTTKLRDEDKCDMVIALTNQWQDEDEELLKKASGIDMIIGGGSHTPVCVRIDDTAGGAMIDEGRSSLVRDDARSRNRWLIKPGQDATHVGIIEIDVRARRVLSVESADVRELLPEPHLQSLVDRVATQAKLINEFRFFPAPLPGQPLLSSRHVKEGQTTLGRLIASMLRRWFNADLCLWHAGNIRGNRDYTTGMLVSDLDIEFPLMAPGTPNGHAHAAAALPFMASSPPRHAPIKITIRGKHLAPLVKHSQMTHYGGYGSYFQFDDGVDYDERELAFRRIGTSPFNPNTLYSVVIDTHLLTGGQPYPYISALAGSAGIIGSSPPAPDRGAAGSLLPPRAPVSPRPNEPLTPAQVSPALHGAFLSSPSPSPTSSGGSTGGLSAAAGAAGIANGTASSLAPLSPTPASIAAAAAAGVAAAIGSGMLDGQLLPLVELWRNGKLGACSPRHVRHASSSCTMSQRVMMALVEYHWLRVYPSGRTWRQLADGVAVGDEQDLVATIAGEEEYVRNNRLLIARIIRLAEHGRLR